MLKLCGDFFYELEKESVRYCHWKSNEHLEAGLDGETDLDILVDQSAHTSFESIATAFGFLRFESVSYLTYPDIEDFIGLDLATGKLVHLHTHWRLRVGKKFVKDVRLPWEELILSTRQKDESTRIWIIRPEIEFILLIVRRVLKNRLNPEAAFSRQLFSADESREYVWLSARCDPDKLTLFGSQLVSPVFAELLKDSTALLHKGTYLGMESQFIHMLRNMPQETGKPAILALEIRYLTRKAYAMLRLVAHKILHLPVLYRRGLPKGGRIIVFVGVDGAGKSTILAETFHRFSWKIDTYRMYFGSGDGESSLLRTPLRLIARRRTKRRGDYTATSQADRERSTSTKKMRIAKVIWAILLASEKKKKFILAQKAREKGLLVLCDRYPQTSFPGLNDGPLLDNWSKDPSSIKRAIAAWEHRIYSLSGLIVPDLVIRLVIPVGTALERKKDTPEYIIRKKADVIGALDFAGAPITDIHTDSALEHSLTECSSAIWKAISS